MKLSAEVDLALEGKKALHYGETPQVQLIFWKRFLQEQEEFQIEVDGHALHRNLGLKYRQGKKVFELKNL